MRYFRQFSNVLLVADDLITHQPNYVYLWKIWLTKVDYITLTDRKIYVELDELGVKHIELTVTDTLTGLSSDFQDDIYVTNGVQPIELMPPGGYPIIPTLVNNGIQGAYFDTRVK